jgi:hypothetical protein
LERRRRSESSKSGSGVDEWDEEVRLGMGDWDGRIDMDERILVVDEVGEGSGSAPLLMGKGSRSG